MCATGTPVSCSENAGRLDAALALEHNRNGKRSRNERRKTMTMRTYDKLIATIPARQGEDRLHSHTGPALRSHRQARR